MFLSHYKKVVSSGYLEETARENNFITNDGRHFRPRRGTVTYEDIDIHKNPETKQKIVYVPDSTNILNGYTVKRNREVL